MHIIGIVVGVALAIVLVGFALTSIGVGLNEKNTDPTEE